MKNKGYLILLFLSFPVLLAGITAFLMYFDKHKIMRLIVGLVCVGLFACLRAISNRNLSFGDGYTFFNVLSFYIFCNRQSKKLGKSATCQEVLQIAKEKFDFTYKLEFQKMKEIYYYGKEAHEMLGKTLTSAVVTKISLK